MLKHRRQKGFKILDDWLTKIRLLLHVAKFTFSQQAYKDLITLTYVAKFTFSFTSTCTKICLIPHKINMHISYT